MKNTIVALFLCFCFLSETFSQRYVMEFSNSESVELYEKAEKAYAKGRYEKSTQLYQQLIDSEGENSQLLFNQLTSLIHSNDTVAIENSFKKLTEGGYLDCYYLSASEDFKQIKYKVKFKLWQAALKACVKSEADYVKNNNIQNPELRKQLLWMKLQDVVSDIKVIHKIRYNAYPKTSYDDLKAERTKIYMNNFSQLLAFTQKSGWPGKSLVGQDGAEAAWLIAQHGNHSPPAQEYLLGLLEKASNENEATMTQYAHLYDRVKANMGKPQKYGTLRWKNPETEAWELYPLEDSTKLNEFRAQAGLPEIKPDSGK